MLSNHEKSRIERSINRFGMLLVTGTIAVGVIVASIGPFATPSSVNAGGQESSSVIELDSGYATVTEDDESSEIASWTFVRTDNGDETFTYKLAFEDPSIVSEGPAIPVALWKGDEADLRELRFADGAFTFTDEISYDSFGPVPQADPMVFTMRVDPDGSRTLKEFDVPVSISLGESIKFTTTDLRTVTISSGAPGRKISKAWSGVISL